MRPLLAFIGDIIVVAVFALRGYQAHHQGVPFSVDDVFQIAAPFLIGLVVMALVTRFWKTFDGWITGLISWAGVLLIGMVLRHFFFVGGVQFSFVLVAGGVLFVLFMIRRAISKLINRFEAKREDNTVAA